MTNNVSILQVILHEKHIGTITNVQGDQSIFSFNRSYIDDEDRATLSLSFKSALGTLLTATNTIQTKLQPFFSNLLPEGHMRDYLATVAGVKEVREFFLLWALGQDLPGALKVISDEDEVLFPQGNASGHQSTNNEKPSILRFSLAGVQLKFSAIANGTKNGGLVIPAKGIGGEWIVKLPSSRFSGVPENEFSMMTIARHVGIEVPEIKLINLTDIENLPEGIGQLSGQAFAIKRFDRTINGSVHIEDFSQVFGVYPNEKYDRATYRRIASVLAAETDENSVKEFIRRLVFSTLIGNDDMHLKNWSLVYPDQKNPILSPAYDLLSTIAYLPSDDAALKYARTKKMSELNRDELQYMAAKAMIPETLVLSTARDTVDQFMTIWTQEKKHLPLLSHVVDAVDKHISTLALVHL